MPLRIGCVVEGHGEVESVPALVRRIAQELDPALVVVIPHPVRVTKSKLLKSGELERAAELAALNVGGNGGVLIVLDCDEDCPALLGPELLGRVRSARADLPSAVVLAKREFESWFLASAESLRGHRGLSENLESPDHPEEIPGAKEWLSNHILSGTYAPTVDQAPLTHALDLTLARRAASFDKCYREIMLLLETLRSQG
jgi:Domain of unknown function (DUF4276)